MPYATIEQLATRWRPLSDAEKPKAQLVLDDVERDIRRDFPDVDTRAAADPGLVLELARITCDVARRRLTGEDTENLEALSLTQGPFGRTQTFRAPTEGGLGFTARERRILAGASTVGDAGLATWTNEP